MVVIAKCRGGDANKGKKDRLDVWNGCKRVYQELPEEDWDWWTTLYPTRLVVQVTDAQK